MSSGLVNAVLSAIVTVMCVSSCSVKEDRSGCPCYVIMNVDEFIRAGLVSGTVSFSAGPAVVREAVVLSDYSGYGYGFPSPKRLLHASCICGMEDCIEDDRICVRANSQAEPVFAFSTSVTPEGEEYLIVAVPHKQYCRIDIKNRDSSLEYRYHLRGGYSCLGIHDLLPSGGELDFPVEPGPDGRCSALLLRQADDAGLMLDIFDAGTSEMISTLDLSELLKDAGYVWMQEDLEDVSLVVDTASLEFRVETTDWNDDERKIEI